MTSVASDENNNDGILRIWRPIQKIINSTRWLGVYIPCSGKHGHTIRVPMAVWSIAILAFNWSMVANSLQFVDLKDGYGTELFYKLMVVLNRLQLSLYLTCAVIWMKHVETIMTIWKNSYPSRPESYWNRLSKHIKRCCFVGIAIPTISIVAVLISMIMAIHAADPYQGYPNYFQLSTPFWSRRDQPWQDMLIVYLSFIPMSMGTMTMWVYWIVLVTVVIIIRFEYNFIAGKLNEYIRAKGIGFTDVRRTDNSPLASPESDTNSGLIYKSLEEYRVEHDVIIRMTEAANRVYSLSIAISLISAIIAMCLALFNMAKGSVVQLNAEFSTTLLNVISSLFYVTYVLVCGVITNDVAHHTSELAFRIDLRRLGIEESIQLQVLLSRLNGPPIGFTVIGLFTIDRNSVLTIIGAIITYAIIVFQFPSSPGGVTVTPTTVSYNTTQLA